MKAYQLKIVIKNSKPPIWRRCFVPAGITFSQLSIILNKVMGWSGYHLSEFEFYHLQLQLMEKDEFHDFVPLWDFDLQDSSKTYINEFMEQQEWFTYTYDFGDDWQHRVTIENIIEDYPNNYPQVIKFKGDCPIEDCGGIEGYYECIDVIGDSDNPESNERKIWAESQGYGLTYDMDEVNADLRKTCYVILGKGENRNQRDIYEDMFDNKFGLKASKTAKNSEKKVQSKRHRCDEILQQIAERISKTVVNKISQEKSEEIDTISLEKYVTEDYIRTEAKRYVEEMLSKNRKYKKIQLIDLLNSYAKEDLKDLAFLYDLRKISMLRKAELADKLKEIMLLPETIKNSFMVLMDDEIQAFERIAEHETAYYLKENEENLLQNLVNMGYVGIRMDNQVDVPEDVFHVYQQVNTSEYKKLRKRISWLLACFDMATWFYGAVPVDVMVRVFEQGSGFKSDYHTLISDYNNTPKNQRDFLLIGNLFVHRNLIEKEAYKHLLRNQGNKDYYIPSEDEIKDIAVNHFVLNDPYVRKLIRYFMDKLDIPEDEAIAAVGEIQHEINGGCSMQDMFDIMNDKEICFNKENDLSEFISLINNLWNNTRMLLNRGYKPSELFEEEKKSFRPFGSGNMPTIVPGSSSAAKLLMDSKEHIEKLGFPIDFNSNAKEMPVYSMPSGIGGSLEVKTKKIYPNDPCPCGSGKKYKKCCGRQII